MADWNIPGMTEESKLNMSEGRVKYSMKIYGFDQLIKSSVNKSEIASKLFCPGGRSEFQILVFPNGIDEKCIGCVSVYLQKLDNWKIKVKTELEFGELMQGPTSTWDLDECRMFGWPTICDHASFGSVLDKDGTLVISVTLSLISEEFPIRRNVETVCVPLNDFLIPNKKQKKKKRKSSKDHINANIEEKVKDDRARTEVDRKDEVNVVGVNTKDDRANVPEDGKVPLREVRKANIDLNIKSKSINVPEDNIKIGDVSKYDEISNSISRNVEVFVDAQNSKLDQLCKLKTDLEGQLSDKIQSQSVFDQKVKNLINCSSKELKNLVLLKDNLEVEKCTKLKVMQEVQVQFEDLEKTMDKLKQEFKSNEERIKVVDCQREKLENQVEMEMLTSKENGSMNDVEIKDLKEKLMETVKAIDYLPNEVFNPPPVKAPVLPCPECPICFEEMKPPVRIVQCKSGHLVCQQCKDMPQVIVCPLCKQEFIGRATGMEKFLRNLFG